MAVPVSIDGKSILTLSYKDLHDLNIMGRSPNYGRNSNISPESGTTTSGFVDNKKKKKI
jgi:hypothetical protein